MRPSPNHHEQVTDRFAVLSEMTRLRLLRLLETEELTVGELATILQMPQSTVSRHLKVLLAGDWIVRRAAGTAGRYKLMLEDLPNGVPELWQLARTQVADSPQFLQDANRLSHVLAQRRVDTVDYFGRVGGEWDAIRADLFGSVCDTDAIFALLDPSWVVVDLGCGTGNLTERMAPHVKSVHVVDMSQAMLDAARKRLGSLKNIEFHCADLLETPLPDGSADIVIFSLVLHHIEEPALAIKEAARILKPTGGRMLLIDMFRHDRLEYRQTMGHRWLGFETSEVESWCRDAGLSPVRIHRLPSPPDATGPDLFAAVATKS